VASVALPKSQLTVSEQLRAFAEDCQRGRRGAEALLREMQEEEALERQLTVSEQLRAYAEETNRDTAEIQRLFLEDDTPQAVSSQAALEKLKAEKAVVGFQDLMTTDPRTLQTIVDEARPPITRGILEEIRHDIDRRSVERDQQRAIITGALPEWYRPIAEAKNMILDRVEDTCIVVPLSAFKHLTAPVFEAVGEMTWGWVESTAKGAALRDHGLMTAGHVLTGSPAPVLTVDESLRGIERAGSLVLKPAQAIGNGVHRGIHTLTGSEVYGDLLTEPVIMLATDGAFRAAPRVPVKIWDLSRSTRSMVTSGVESGLDVIRRVEINIDRTVMGSGPTGITFELKPKFNPKDPTFHDRVATHGSGSDRIKLYREKETGLWYSKDKAGMGHGGCAWKKFKEENKKLTKVADVDINGRDMVKQPSDTLMVIKMKDLTFQGGGK
jgi:hypothetical protein